MRARLTWWTLLLAAPLSAAEVERSAVVAGGQCSVAGSAISARTFRAALLQRVGPSVQTEVETAAPLGGLAQRTLPELSTALISARGEFYSDKSDAALATLKHAVSDVLLLVPSEARWAVERDMLTFKSQVELKTDRPAAEATLLAIFRVDPNYKPDTSVYPPSFQRFADDVRKVAKRLVTNRLDISVSPPGRAVFVGGKPQGLAPLSIRLPPGEYRVEVDWGYRGLARMVSVQAPPALPRPLELAASVEGAVAPDGGPCLEVHGDLEGALTRLLPLVNASKVYGVRTASAAGVQFALVTEVRGGGYEARTVRVKIQAGAPEGDALGLIASYFQTGRPNPLVDVLAKGAPDVEVVAPPLVLSTAPAASLTRTTTAGSGLRTTGWVLGGVGVAGIAVGLVEFLSAQSQKSDLTNQQVNGAFPAGTQASFSSTNDSIKSKQTIAVIAGGIGVAALVTGVAFIVIGGNQASAGLSVTPSIVPGGGGAVLAGSF
jgi:hypothetical protein